MPTKSIITTLDDSDIRQAIVLWAEKYLERTIDVAEVRTYSKRMKIGNSAMGGFEYTPVVEIVEKG